MWIFRFKILCQQECLTIHMYLFCSLDWFDISWSIVFLQSCGERSHRTDWMSSYKYYRSFSLFSWLSHNIVCVRYSVALFFARFALWFGYQSHLHSCDDGRFAKLWKKEKYCYRLVAVKLVFRTLWESVYKLLADDLLSPAQTSKFHWQVFLDNFYLLVCTKPVAEGGPGGQCPPSRK